MPPSVSLNFINFPSPRSFDKWSICHKSHLQKICLNCQMQACLSTLDFQCSDFLRKGWGVGRTICEQCFFWLDANTTLSNMFVRVSLFTLAGAENLNFLVFRCGEWGWQFVGPTFLHPTSRWSPEIHKYWKLKMKSEMGKAIPWTWPKVGRCCSIPPRAD